MKDVELAKAIVPLLERGGEELRAYINGLPPWGQPLGGAKAIGKSIHIVTHADFCAHPALVLRYVVESKVPVHVLCEDGHLCALLAKHTSTF